MPAENSPLRRSAIPGVEFPTMETGTPTRIARAYILSIVIWSALSLLTGWNYLIFDQTANLRSSLRDMLILAEGRGLAYALLTPPLFFIVAHFSFGPGSRWRSLLAYVIGAAPFMLICSEIRWLICPPWNPTEAHFVTRGSSSPLVLVHDSFADLVYNYIAIVVAAHAYNYFERVRKQELDRSKIQEALAASELQTLKMQLHPHFLFNTLHGISTLIDSDKKSAQAMIVKLSNLLRIALEHSGSDLIPLQDELKFAREYLDIEQMRFGSRLKVTTSIHSATLRCMVPQLILQPLVENAVRHGIASSRENGWVAIASKPCERGLELSVRNSVGGSRPKGSGVGLRNTKARLRYFYADEATVSFSIDADQTATVILVLPNLESHIEAGNLVPARYGVENGDGEYARADYGR
jgi:two-component system, LytTR family, sensor kinase